MANLWPALRTPADPLPPARQSPGRATRTEHGRDIRFSGSLLEEHGIDVTSVLLVSKPYEERRAYASAGKLWPDVEFLCASTPVAFKEYVDTIGDARLVVDMQICFFLHVIHSSARGRDEFVKFHSETLVSFIEGFLRFRLPAGEGPEHAIRGGCRILESFRRLGRRAWPF